MRSNPVSKGSKDLLPPTSYHYNRYIVTIAVDSFQQEGDAITEYIIKKTQRNCHSLGFCYAIRT
ncbi:hypothetical protein CLOSYM_00700 [[Clostridium] symbiosum ATCC 14940]|uniref:Uncharacterized protein n=1 Tax=[Clostridium] symbiosum ATCC 14940 TaxID=411472 RepID=A0ABC9U266_CLOSY|nr:hypothetical protein CLOSYM_00700 [[Clostridium] symbiosum ATCC 14940]